MTCFLDMDGVLADFVEGASRAHGRPSPFADPNVHGAAAWDMAKVWGITEAEFWAPTETPEFWADLLPTAEAEDIVKMALALFGEPHVGVLTAPSQSPWCLPGKRAWMGKYFPILEDKMIFCDAGAKRLMARSDAVLVDDRDRNISQWIVAGGKGILVPRQWNSQYKLNTWEAVRNGFERISGRGSEAQPTSSRA